MQEKEIIDKNMVMNIINKLDVFDRFTEKEKKALVKQNNHFAVYKNDEALIQEGDNEGSFFVLISGTVRVTKRNLSLNIADLQPGDSFGEISFLTETPRTASVVANENDVIVLKIDKEILGKLDVNIREKIKDKIIEKLIERLDRMNNALARLSY